MKTLLPTAVMSLAAVTGAVAADLPVYTKAPPRAVFSWTGFYVGANAGVAIDGSAYELDPTGCFLTGCGFDGVAANPGRTFTGAFRQAALTGGAQAGYNLQAGAAWLAGIEADTNYNGIDESFSGRVPLGAPLVGTTPLTQTQRVGAFGTVRARVGFVPSERLLLYATGGLAFGEINAASNVRFLVTTDQYAGSASVVRAGWTGGGGVEWAFANHWSAKAEYLHVDLGSFSYVDACVTPTPVCGTPFPTYATHLTAREDILRLGLNYKIN